MHCTSHRTAPVKWFTQYHTAHTTTLHTIPYYHKIPDCHTVTSLTASESNDLHCTQYHAATNTISHNMLLQTQYQTARLHSSQMIYTIPHSTYYMCTTAQWLQSTISCIELKNCQFRRLQCLALKSALILSEVQFCSARCAAAQALQQNVHWRRSN